MLAGGRGERAARAPSRVGVLLCIGAPAREGEVPVRADGRPARATVLRLVDLLEPRVDVVRVLRVDDDELVVPGLNAGAVALPVLRVERGSGRGCAELVGRRDAVPRACERARR